MLTVNDLINISRIPEEHEISLSLLLDFYEQYLCTRVFIFTLENGDIIKLLFKDTEIFHISGIDHIYENVPMDGTRFINDIRSGALTLQRVENVNPAAYTDYLDRIRSMFCIDTIIKQCKYLYFPDGKIPNSDISVTYLLLKGLDGKNLHLGIDRYRPGKPFFSRTLLITERNSAEKFISVSSSQFKISKLEIKDKVTDNILEIVDRNQAKIVVRNNVISRVNMWLDSNFESKIRKLFENKIVQSQLIDEFIKIASCNIRTLHPDIADTLNILENMPISERTSFLCEILADVLKTESTSSHLLKICISDLTIYGAIFDNTIHRKTKDIWAKEIVALLQQEKAVLSTLAMTHDPYGYNTVVAESIRDFEKNDCITLLNIRCDEFRMNNYLLFISAIIRSHFTANTYDICERISRFVVETGIGISSDNS